MLTRLLWNWGVPFILSDGLGAGLWGLATMSSPTCTSFPFALLCSPDPILSHLCLIGTRTIELFLWLLVWNESVQGQTCGAGKGEEWESGSQQHGATDQPWCLCQGRTSFCQQEIETSLVLWMGDNHRSVKYTNWQEVALDSFYLNVLFVCKYWCMN